MATMRKHRLFWFAALARSFPAFCACGAFWLLGSAGALAQGPGRAQSLIENGTFEDSADPFKGWIVDYAWTKNKYYAENKDHVTVVDKVDGRSRAVFLGKEECKMETVPMPFEAGFRYRCRLEVKKGKYPMRIYFAGYKWKPGIRPHEKPEIWELANIYRGNAAEPTGSTWCQMETQLPGKQLSDTAKSMLQQVRFLTLYIWTGSPAYVDNVVIEKIPDPTVKF